MSVTSVFRGLIPETVANGLGLIRMLVGTARHETVNCAAADVVPTMKNCRAIYADQASGIVKISYVDDSDGETYTEVIELQQGVFYPIRNVTRVFRYYVGTTACTAKAWGDTGLVVTGIKLRR
jgi:hypothetical protein